MPRPPTTYASSCRHAFLIASWWRKKVKDGNGATTQLDFSAPCNVMCVSCNLYPITKQSMLVTAGHTMQSRRKKWAMQRLDIRQGTCLTWKPSANGLGNLTKQIAGLVKPTWLWNSWGTKKKRTCEYSNLVPYWFSIGWSVNARGLTIPKHSL